jgi:AraC family L-rhamnose operon transcriptional activator RhaR
VIYRPNSALLHLDRLRPYLQPSQEQSGERRYWQISGDLLGRLKPLLSALARESQSPGAASEFMAQALFVQLVVTLWRDRFATDGEGLSPMARLAHVVSYLRQNCAQPIDLDELAHRFGYSSRNFRRVFREATASTPHDYLVKLRLGRAMRALRSSDAKVIDVALASGFNDSNYFSSSFRKLTGMSPSRYRQQTGDHEANCQSVAPDRRVASES